MSKHNSYRNRMIRFQMKSSVETKLQIKEIFHEKYGSNWTRRNSKADRSGLKNSFVYWIIVIQTFTIDGCLENKRSSYRSSLMNDQKRRPSLKLDDRWMKFESSTVAHFRATIKISRCSLWHFRSTDLWKQKLFKMFRFPQTTKTCPILSSPVQVIFMLNRLKKKTKFFALIVFRNYIHRPCDFGFPTFLIFGQRSNWKKYLP